MPKGKTDTTKADFDTLMAMGNTEDPKPEKKDEKPDPLATLTKEFEDFKTQAASREERYQTMVENLMLQKPASQPAQPAATREDAMAALTNFDDAPDPVDDKKGFLRYMGERVRSAIEAGGEAAIGRMTTAQSQQNQGAQLWAEFETEYVDQAKHKGLAQGLATTVLNEMVAQGYDRDALLGRGRATLFKRVAAAVDKEIADIRGAAKGDDEKEEAPARADTTVGHTPRAPGTPPPDDDTEGAFHKELSEFREKGGFF